ncbi:Serine/threonine protein kinase [Giardia duodenalis]|uniref:Serine/threonine protein kinase n=1 Tax=Giardia intestinalis TaxID=5741 RepID=V6TS61_GIAIN|nr:Serine/threonine protein kinase [Giardia intestinalis]
MLAIYFAVGALAAECKPSASGGTNINDCAVGKCELVGATEICTECKQGKVPINGACVAFGDGKVTGAGCKDSSGQNPTAASVKCEQCDLANYFLYKGGCYSTSDATGQKLCTAATTAGVCTQGAEGYFAVPGATKTDQSVVACGDTTGVTVSTNNKYVGVDGCAKCDAPSPITGATSLTTAAATCTECTGTKIVKTVTASGKSVTSCVEPAECKDGFFVDATATPNECTACTNENCNACTGAGEGKCTSCKDGDKKYLKKADGSLTGTCVDEAGCTTGSTHYPDDTGTKTCKSCAEGVSNCKTCTKDSGSNTVTCSACLEGFFAESKSTCTACADSNRAVCDGGADQCSKCKDSFNLEGGKCTSASTNKSSLSTGAIAGISIAAVVVVGGLVGFLCWWFVCRGKA